MSQVKTATQPNLVDRTRDLLTPLNLHFAGVGLLALINLYLLIHMAFAWQSARSQDATAIAQQNTQLFAAEHAAQPLRGLDGKLTKATASADDFYARRLPYAVSQIVGELGALAKKQGIRLSRDSFAYAPVLAASAGAVTEVRIDANLIGDYRPLMLFLNSLERDRTFFLISGITLTGQQSGTVNLRIRLITYLGPPVGSETAEKTGPADSGSAAASAEEPR